MDIVQNLLGLCVGLLVGLGSSGIIRVFLSFINQWRGDYYKKQYQECYNLLYKTDDKKRTEILKEEIVIKLNQAIKDLQETNFKLEVKSEEKTLTREKILLAECNRTLSEALKK